MNGLGLLPNALFTGHLNANSTGRGLSAELWQRAHATVLSPDGQSGTFHFDDFSPAGGYAPGISGGTTLPSVAGPAMGAGYAVYVDTGTSTGSFLPVDDVTGGVLRVLTGVTDNHLSIMNTGAFGEISRTAAEKAITIFEARIALPTQVTSGSSFVGLANQVSVADGGLIVDTGELIATGAGIGFRTLDADPDGLDFVYKAASQTTVVSINNLNSAMTAGTFVKVGFIYDPSAPVAKRISVFYNGTKQSTYVTDTHMAAATFPNSVHLGMHAAVKGDAGTARALDIDWWACWQGPVVA
jgi:hypothetical protein